MNRAVFTLLGFAILCLSTADADPGEDRPGPSDERAERRDSGERHRHRLPPLMRALDADQDGSLSSEEIANAPAVLRGLDKDRDGNVSPREWAPSHAGDRGRRGPPEDFERGRRGPSEDFERGRRGPSEDFERGRRGPPEDFERGRRGPPDRGRSEGNERRGFQQEGSAQRTGVSRVINRLFENDRDGDDKLSRDEVPQGKQGIFDLADTNQDGHVDRSELESALRKKRQ